MLFVTKSGQFWGWIDRGRRGEQVLELSLHSRRDLARENNSRIITDEIKQYIVTNEE